MRKPEEKKEKKPLIKFGPFEQAIGVLLFMGWAANPSLPYALLSQPNPWSGSLSSGFGANGGGIPLFTPPLMFLVLIAYLGYSVLQRQEAARNRQKALAKAASKSSSSSSSKSSSSSSSSSSKAMSSSDVRAKGMPSSSSSSKHGDPAPKLVSGGSGMDPREDPSSTSFKKNYFLTMQGPGRPALVPFQDGLRPKAGEAEGTMWWDNVPDGASSRIRATPEAKGPWATALKCRRGPADGAAGGPGQDQVTHEKPVCGGHDRQGHRAAEAQEAEEGRGRAIRKGRRDLADDPGCPALRRRHAPRRCRDGVLPVPPLHARAGEGAGRRTAEAGRRKEGSHEASERGEEGRRG